jgi:hypothetical protein
MPAQSERHSEFGAQPAASPPSAGTPIGKEEVIGDQVTSREDHRVSSKRLYLLGIAIVVLAVVAAIAFNS